MEHNNAADVNPACRFDCSNFYLQNSALHLQIRSKHVKACVEKSQKFDDLSYCSGWFFVDLCSVIAQISEMRVFFGKKNSKYNV